MFIPWDVFGTNTISSGPAPTNSAMRCLAGVMYSGRCNLINLSMFFSRNMKVAWLAAETGMGTEPYEPKHADQAKTHVKGELELEETNHG